MMKRILAFSLIVFLLCIFNVLGATANLVINEGFENSTTDWTIIDASHVSIDNTIKHSGNNSLKISGNTTTKYVIKQTVPNLVIGTEYVLSFYSKKDNTDDYLDIVGAEFPDAGWRIVPKSTDFALNSYSFIAVATSVTINIINNDGTAYYDDFRIIPKPNAPLVSDYYFTAGVSDSYSIVFSEDMDEATFGQITVKDSNMETVPFIKEYLNRIVTLHFNDKLDEYINFSVDLSKVMSVDGMLLSSNSSLEFFTGDPNVFRVVGTIPTTVDNKISTLTIEFSHNVDSQTLQDNFDITRNSVSIGGIIIARVDSTNPKKVILNFGKLESNADYILSIRNSICSQTGSNVLEKSFNFHTSGMIIEENFQGYEYVVDQKVPMNSEISYTSNEVVNNTDGITVKQEGNNKYISLNTTGGSTAVLKNFNTQQTGTIVLDLNIRASNATGGYDSDARSLGRITGADSANPSISVDRFLLGFTFNNVGNIFTYTDYVNRYFPSGSEFINVKIKYKRNENGVYMTTLYDVNGNEIVTYLPGLGNESGLTHITGIMLGGIYKAAGVAQFDRLDMDDIKLYYVNEPSVMATSIDDISPSPDIQTIDIYFDEDMDVTTLSSQNIQLKNKMTGEFAKTNGIYDANKRKYTITLLDYLNYNSDYEISFNIVKSAQNIAIAKTVEFSTQKTDVFCVDNVVTLTQVATQLKSNFQLKNNTSSTQNTTAVLAVYDTNDCIVKILAKNYTLESLSSQTFNDLVITNISYKEGYYANFYLFDNATSSKTNLSKVAKINLSGGVQ